MRCAASWPRTPTGPVDASDATVRSRRWLIATLAVAMLVGVVSLLPARGTPGGDIADLGETLATVGHLAAYAVLGFGFAMALPGSASRQRYRRSWRAVLVVVILSAYGVLLELAQLVLGSRSFQWQDVLANAGGAVLGVMAGLVLGRTVDVRPPGQARP